MFTINALPNVVLDNELYATHCTQIKFKGFDIVIQYVVTTKIFQISICHTEMEDHIVVEL